MASARLFIPAFVLFGSSCALFSRTARPTTRVTTNYMLRETVRDTGQLTQAFVAGLAGDSLVDVVPDRSTKAPSADAHAKATQFLISLTAAGVQTALVFRVRVVSVANSRVVFQDGTTSAPDSVLVELQRLGQRVTNYLVPGRVSRPNR